MKVGELLASRRENWHELERLCEQMRSRRKKSMGAESISRFATLYRAACADLALADAYQLPPNTVQYLHRLVGRAHNQLYRGSGFDLKSWGHVLMVQTPQRLFNDGCVQVAFCLFWGIFILSAHLAHSPTLWPGFTEQIVPAEQIEALEQMHGDSLGGRSWETSFAMTAFYIKHNAWIGLQCFAFCLAIVPGILILIYNASMLGAVFGHMFRPDIAAGENFREFVMAHGPFELTAIVLSAAAGLRIGVSSLITGGLTRKAAIQRAGREAMPIMGAALLLFFLAAMIEAFISPSELPWQFKAAVAVVSSGLLMFYFVVLGFPRGK